MVFSLAACGGVNDNPVAGGNTDAANNTPTTPYDPIVGAHDSNNPPQEIQIPSGNQNPEPQLTEEEINAKLKASVIKVICYDYDGITETSQGSGFFIDDDGTFITNAHVVKDCFYIKIKTHLGITHDVDVMYKYNGTVSDYAICKAKTCFSSQPVEFATTASAGDTVYALGYPNDSFVMKTTSGKSPMLMLQMGQSIITQIPPGLTTVAAVEF